MGVDSKGRRHIVTAFDETQGCLTARNVYNTAFHPQWTVLCSTPKPCHFTCDVSAWHEHRLHSQCGAGLDPCMGTVTDLQLYEGRLTAVVVLGAAENHPGVQRVSELAHIGRAKSELVRTKAWWLKKVRPVEVQTASPALNHYLNGWALYQVLASRLFARASLYQCGGAYGFRDQLQDVCAALFVDPSLTKNQILRACVHQFEEGDVQHWWHPSKRTAPNLSDRGVRTRCSDDLVWLPYTLCEYIDKTGNDSLLDFFAPYISAPELNTEEHDRFDVPHVSDLRESVYHHCVRALECVLRRGRGTSGLLLIGGGDWNDGFDKVGIGGKGESTWLTWFTAHVLARFAPYCERNQDTERAAKYRTAAQSLAYAADSVWDGDWYRRGTFDDGSPLGSHTSEECQIDSIAQSFALWVPDHTPERAHRGLNSAYERLVDTKHQLIRLYTPPFDKSGQNPGYIKGYLPGVRENGAQYTHAAVWFTLGQFLDGRTDTGLELLELLLPENHPPACYKGDPHVLAADVYTSPGHEGRGGWSHYTGAAAWYYRVALEQLLGVTLKDGLYRIAPKVPVKWGDSPPIVKVSEDKANLLRK